MSYLTKAREPISSLSHMIGAVAFAFATLLLVGKTLGDAWTPKILVGVIVFGFRWWRYILQARSIIFPMVRPSGSCVCASWIIL